MPSVSLATALFDIIFSVHMNGGGARHDVELENYTTYFTSFCGWCIVGKQRLMPFRQPRQSSLPLEHETRVAVKPTKHLP